MFVCASFVRTPYSVRPVTLDGPQIGTQNDVNLRREKLFNWSKTVQKTSFGHVLRSQNYVNLRRGKLFNWSKTVQKQVLVTVTADVLRTPTIATTVVTTM